MFSCEKYMNQNPFKRILGLVFPSRTYMKKRGYEGVEKGGIHIPIAYVMRLTDLMKSVVTGKKSVRKSVVYKVHEVENDVQKQRIDLMADLCIIQKQTKK